MDLLKAELAKKKAAFEAHKEKLQINSGNKQRFIRRSDLLRVEEQERLEKLKREELEAQEKKRKLEEEEQLKRFAPSILLACTNAPQNPNNSDVQPSKKCRNDSFDVQTLKSNEHVEETQNSSSPVPLNDNEVKQMLRELGKEVTLFGETSAERVDRLRAAQAEVLHDAEDYELGEGHEVSLISLHFPRNLFVRKGSMGSKSGDHEEEEDEEKDEGPVSDYTYVRRYLRSLLKQWEEDLNARPDHVKSSVLGKRDTWTQKQCKDYLRPLFKLCKQHNLNAGILKNLVKIVDYMKEGEFVKAHDVYMLTAIGNAPWPIGLTMVGIHERSGREKIESRKVAHIMNNEAQRKYLVSIKRLMTYSQEKRTDVPPSKKVL